MERSKSLKEKKKKRSIILKTLERCKSLGRKKTRAPQVTKSKSFPQHVAPEGYVTVFVGSDKERFMIRMGYVNHPLFKELLDEAEFVYGFACDGPVRLPCDVDRFYRVLWEIDECKCDVVKSPLCRFPPSPLCGFNGKDYAGYRVLDPFRLVVVD